MNFRQWLRGIHHWNSLNISSRFGRPLSLKSLTFHASDLAGFFTNSLPLYDSFMQHPAQCRRKLRGDMLLHCTVSKADCRQDQIPGRRIGTAIFVAWKHVENLKPQNLMYPQHRCSAILLMSLRRIRTMKLHVTPWNEYNFKTKHSDRGHKSIEVSA